MTQPSLQTAGVALRFWRTAGRKPQADPRQDDRRLRLIDWLARFGIVISLAVFVQGVGMLLDARNEVWQQTEESSANLALSLARDIARTIEVYDLSLQGARDVLQQPGIGQVPAALRQAAVFDRAASAEYLGSMLVLDAAGDVSADSTSIVPHVLNLGDRDYFRAQKADPDAGLFVSLPFHSRLRGGDTSIALSRRISAPDGSFAGVIMGALRLEYFSRLFQNYQLGSKAAITLIRDDGRLLARYPMRDKDIGRDVSQSPGFRSFGTAASGEVVSKASIDGIRRLVVFRRLPGLPLIVTVAVGMDDIYAAWWRKAAGIGAVLAILCGSTMCLCLLFRDELKRRLANEGRLRAAAAQLAVTADTDALTGLGNRRHFETALSREWRQAIRSETELSLLLLDADSFKLYNDRYGHPEGDKVLQAIASCVQASIRRPSDIGARYGGEEFVSILPETPLEGALIIAERIRGTVAALAIAHAGSAAGIVTVSIGVACMRPQLDEESSVLLQAADAQMYEAKRSGKNRVCAEHAAPTADAVLA